MSDSMIELATYTCALELLSDFEIKLITYNYSAKCSLIVYVWASSHRGSHESCTSARCSDAVMQWCSDAVMQVCSGAVMQWCSDENYTSARCSDAVMQRCRFAVVQWCRDAVMQWCSHKVTHQPGAAMQWCSDAVMQRCRFAVMQWCSDAMVQWCRDAVMQWCSDENYTSARCSDAVMQWCSDDNTWLGLARTVYTHTVYDCMYGDFPAKNTVYIPYILINVWFWPTLSMYM